MKKLTTLAFFTVFLFSCSPFTKEAYLERFEDFMDEVSVEYRQYDESQWVKADKKFERLTGQWYDRYKDELSSREKLTISGYKVRYKTYKGIKKIDSAFQDLF